MESSRVTGATGGVRLSRLTGWYAACSLALMPIWTVVPMVLQLKKTQLELARASELLQALPASADRASSFLLPLSLYRGDAWLLGLALPVSLMLLLSLVPARKRAWVTGGISTLLLVVLFIELKVLWDVGTFLPMSFLVRGIFQAGGLQLGGDYVSAGSLAKLGGLVGLTWLSVWLCRRVVAGPPPRGVASAASGFTTALLGCGILSSFLPPSGLPALERGVTGGALSAFVGWSEPGPIASVALPPGLSQREVIEEYRRLTNAPVPNVRSRYFGSAAGFNVVLVILETAPEDCIGLTSRGATYPAVDSLLKRSFVARRHYATYPWTLRALYSIYTSWYPASSPMQLVPRALTGADGKMVPVPGFVRAARSRGYFTKVYLPRGADDWDVPFAPMSAAGFESHIAQPGGSIEGSNQPERLSWRRQRDQELLDSLKADLRTLSRDRARPFLLSFQPQLTHAPWPGVADASNPETACATARELFKESDRQVGEIRRTLVESGLDSRTVLIVTGDHGFRTRTEFPWLSAAVMEELSYRVPLFVFVPGLLTAPQELPWPTSHIDIGPSVLDLLGIETGRATELGSPVWADSLQHRRVFVWGEGFLGANGFIDSTGAYMIKYQLDGVAENHTTGTLEFRVADLVLHPGERASLEGKIERMRVIRDRLAELQRRADPAR